MLLQFIAVGLRIGDIESSRWLTWHDVLVRLVLGAASPREAGRWGWTKQLTAITRHKTRARLAFLIIAICVL